MGSVCAAEKKTNLNERCTEIGPALPPRLVLRMTGRPSPASLWHAHPENEADDGGAGRGHDFGAVGHEVEQYGHDALCCVVELVTQQ